MINCIDVDPHHPGGVYVAATAYKFGDYTPYLYKSKDYGETWTVITLGTKKTITREPSELIYSSWTVVCRHRMGSLYLL